MANCPSCNNPVTPGAAFCDNCGASLAGLSAQPAPPPPAAFSGGAICPQCNHPVTPGEAFCDNCGASLTAPPPMQQAPVPPPAMPQYTPAPVAAPPAGVITCGSCGTANAAGQAFCDNCGNALSGQPAPGQQPVPFTPPPAPGMRPRLVAASGAQFDLTGKTQAIIGREDPVSGIFPEVDLTPHGGDAGGVSRQHARLAFSGYQWTVEDLNSTNYTFVNNQKLNPKVPQPLNNGDQLRLGKVVLMFQLT